MVQHLSVCLIKPHPRHGGHSCLSLWLQGSSCTKRDEKLNVVVESFCVVSTSAVPVVTKRALLMWEDAYQMLGHSESARLC